MEKRVYLFELDSVRKTDNEIIRGQKALFNEISHNGNVVVLTFNQFVDSRGFFSLLDADKNKDYYDCIIKLFKDKRILISQYGNYHTISQFLIDKCRYDSNFIFSGWPLKSTQKRLLALIRRSLMYSDLSEIREYKEGIKTDAELKELFTEVQNSL